MKSQLPSASQVWWWPWRGTWTHTYRPSWEGAGCGEGCRGCPSLAGGSSKRGWYWTSLINTSHVLPDRSQPVTHPSYGPIREEPGRKAAHEASQLQGTHVGTPCGSQSSRCQHPSPVRWSEKPFRRDGSLKKKRSIPIRTVWPFSCMRNSCPQSVAAVFTPNTTK